MKKAWKIFDKNGDGKLTPQEFRCNGKETEMDDGENEDHHEEDNDDNEEY